MNQATKKPPAIALCPCESSQIAAHGYDAATQTMALQFKRKGENGERVGGSIYHYDNVPPEVYDEFCKCESKGGFFGQRIKIAPSKYPYRKIG